MTSITWWIVLWKFRIGLTAIAKSHHMSALIFKQLCVPSSRYNRRDSLQVVGIPYTFTIIIKLYSFAILVV